MLDPDTLPKEYLKIVGERPTTRINNAILSIYKQSKDQPFVAMEETMQDIARLKNKGIKLQSKLESKEQMLADGIIKQTERIKYFLICKSIPIIFFIIKIFKMAETVKHKPKPQIKEFIPTILGKNQIDIINKIAPKI